MWLKVEKGDWTWEICVIFSTLSQLPRELLSFFSCM